MSTTRSSASERVIRLMSFGIGLAAAVFAGQKMPDILAQGAVLAPWWTAAALALYVAPAAALAPLAFVAPMRVLRILATVSAGSFVLIGPAAVIAIPGGHLPAEFSGVWPLTISAAATSIAAIWWPSIVVWPYLLVTTIELELVRAAMISTEPDWRITTLDGFYTLLFNTVFVALALALHHVARQLDIAAATAARETQAVASAAARERERLRVGALIHDHVLVALLTGANSEERRRALAPSLARSAIAALTADPEQRTPQDESTLDWTWRLQATTTHLAPDARFDHDLLGTDLIPATAAEALSEAAAEAIRNSVRHADVEGREISRHVHVLARPGLFEVTVLDNGRGFDPQRVNPSRLGIAVSITSRMLSTPGCESFVVSAPGRGTRVTLRWSSQ